MEELQHGLVLEGGCPAHLAGLYWLGHGFALAVQEESYMLLTQCHVFVPACVNWTGTIMA